jgi:hypothetical protein
MEIVIGLILGILAMFGLKKFQPKQDLPENLNDEKVDELETELERLDRVGKEIEEGNIHKLSSEEIEEYWMKRK